MFAMRAQSSCRLQGKVCVLTVAVFFIYFPGSNGHTVMLLHNANRKAVLVSFVNHNLAIVDISIVNRELTFK